MITAVNEIYLGKEPIDPLLMQLKKIRTEVRSAPYNNGINISKNVLKFNRMMEDFFGYTTFSLTINPSNSVNAYAMNTSFYQTKEERDKMIKSLRSNDNGFKYDKSMGSLNSIISINYGTMKLEDLTDEELMAILLHEIGHTFFDAVLYNDAPVSKTQKVLSIIGYINKKIISRMSSGEDVKDTDIDKDIEKINPIVKMIGKIPNIFNLGKFILNNKYIKKMSKLFHHESLEYDLKRNNAYTNEKFADTFASMYGYGPELHSGLSKLTSYYTKIYPESNNQIVVVLGVFKRYMEYINEYLYNMLDEHPNDLARMKISTEYLKKELSRESLDPKMKTEMIAQLEQLNKAIDDFINFPKNEDYMRITRMYYIKLLKKYGGDIRERKADNDEMFDKLDSVYYNSKNNR